jgi:rod shape-determining protein MreD
VTPSLTLIFAVYCGIHFRGGRGTAMGFLIGLVQDGLSGGLLGINTLSKSLVAFALFKIRDKIVVEGVIPVGCLITGASLFDGTVYYIASSTLLKAGISAGTLFPLLPVYALCNMLAAPILFYLLDRNKKWLLRKNPHQALLPS